MDKESHKDESIVIPSFTRSQRWIASYPYAWRGRIKEVLTAHGKGQRVIHQLGRPVKASPTIKKCII
jgi:hypothetical protein